MDDSIVRVAPAAARRRTAIGVRRASPSCTHAAVGGRRRGAGPLAPPPWAPSLPPCHNRVLDGTKPCALLAARQLSDPRPVGHCPGPGRTGLARLSAAAVL